MTLKTSSSRFRRFEPGTTGWTEDDLDLPPIERKWRRGGYEIVEGVLTKMAAAYLEGSLPLRRLVRVVERHLEQSGEAGEFAFEADMVVNRIRVPRVDAVFLTPQQLEQQRAMQALRQGKRQHGSELRYGRLRIPPELIIESISLGHEDHDRQTKHAWYSGFGVANYWVLDAYRRTLECLVLEGGAYRLDTSGQGENEISPAMFQGLIIPLGKLWV